MGTEHDDPPDACCLSGPDGDCVSTDPRCMHNKPFSYHRDGSRECGSHADHQKLPEGNEVILERRFYHTNLILQAIHDGQFDVWWLNIRRDNDHSDHPLWGIFMDRDDVLAKFATVSL